MQRLVGDTCFSTLVVSPPLMVLLRYHQNAQFFVHNMKVQRELTILGLLMYACHLLRRLCVLIVSTRHVFANEETLPCVTWSRTTYTSEDIPNTQISTFDKIIQKMSHSFVKLLPHGQTANDGCSTSKTIHLCNTTYVHSQCIASKKNRSHSDSISNPCSPSEKSLFTRSKPHFVNKNLPLGSQHRSPYHSARHEQKEIAKLGFDPRSSGLACL